FERTGIVLGPGDDCALLDIPKGYNLALSVDTLNEGVHFPAGADAYQLAQRCLRVNLSDLAAMGAEPLGFTLALSLPDVSESWLQGFSQGLSACAGNYRCSLLGGDTTRGPLAITIQVHGLVAAGQALRRSGASVGDAIYVTGTLGNAALALPYLTHQSGYELADLSAEQRGFLQVAFYQPEPRVHAGLALTGLASAAIDVSDGLASDLGHILQASGSVSGSDSDMAALGAIIDTAQIPLAAEFAGLAAAHDALPLALGGGDDYELCVTVPPQHEAQAQAAMKALNLRFSRIGEVIAGSGIMLRDANGESQPMRLSGYRHFGGGDNE
ncbi:MAG: thiamine-phosphate kinase, partial [Pseudohongiella sp.]